MAQYPSYSISVALPPEDLQALKVLALTRGISLKTMVEDLLLNYLDYLDYSKTTEGN